MVDFKSLVMTTFSLEDTESQSYPGWLPGWGRCPGSRFSLPVPQYRDRGTLQGPIHFYFSEMRNISPWGFVFFPGGSWDSSQKPFNEWTRNSTHEDN